MVAALKRLKLGPMAATLPDRLVLADKQDMVSTGTKMEGPGRDSDRVC